MRRFVSFLIAALAFPLCCLAQDASTGAIQGIVLDPSNSRIAGATVALVNDATGFHYEQTTDSVGRFAFELLPPGEYSARVTADGMPPQLSQNLRVNVGPALPRSSSSWQSPEHARASRFLRSRDWRKRNPAA